MIARVLLEILFQIKGFLGSRLFPEVPHIANIDPVDQVANEEITEIVE